jgi:anti-sigma factor RsiW
MPDPDQTDCKQIAEMLGAFRDMELSVDEADMVESHLSDCAQCKQELAAIEMVVARLQALPQAPVKDFADLIEARILATSAAAPQPEAHTADLRSAKNSVTVVVTSPAPLVNLQPAAAAQADNVVPLVKTSARPGSRFSVRALMAVAAALCMGLIAASTLVTRPPAEIAQAPAVSAGSTAGKKLETDRGGAPLSDDIVALYDEDAGNNVSEAGISTNEDGLYAIKM